MLRMKILISYSPPLEGLGEVKRIEDTGLRH